MRPGGTPIGLQLARTSKNVGRAFGDALAQAGGSLPVWLILTTLRGEAHASQHELARAIGIEDRRSPGISTSSRRPGSSGACRSPTTAAPSASSRPMPASLCTPGCSRS